MASMGEFFKVANVERKEDPKGRRSEDEFYYSIYVEDMDGGNERTLFLTDKEVLKLSVVAIPVLFTARMVLGRLYPVMIGKRVSNFIRVRNEADEEITLQVSNRQLEVFRKRCETHPKSEIKKGWLKDILD